MKGTVVSLQTVFLHFLFPSIFFTAFSLPDAGDSGNPQFALRLNEKLSSKMLPSFKFVFLCGFSIVVRGEVYSSASDMKNIFEMEADLAHILDSYSNTLQDRLDRINKYIEVNQRTFR